MFQTDPELTMQALIQRLSGHMDVLASEVHQIEFAVAEEFTQPGSKVPRNIARLQRLDFLRQALEDMALLLLYLSEDCFGKVDPEIPDRLRLEVSKSLLENGAPQASNLGSEEELGEVDLF
ncbi:MAG: hypothetical protein ABJL67_09925 [Sulfitobacter sp.]